MDRTDADPADVFEHLATPIARDCSGSDGTGDGIGRTGDRASCGPAERSLEEESNPWKETKCAQLATAVCTTDSSVEKHLRPAGGCALYTSETRFALEPWKRGDRTGSRAACGGRGKKVRTLAGAFEPIFTMTETRAARGSGVA
jgi:hypothetical protein